MVSGLRERKKQRTREAIASAAADLFSRHGFAAVTIDEVARTAGVSRQTIFNYFPTKESMLFDREPEIEAALVAAVRDRGPGSSPTDAFRAHTRAFWTRLGSLLEHGPLPHGFWEVVHDSPALRDHMELMTARHARRVAAVLAAERGVTTADPVCMAVARALCGANVSILIAGMDRLIAGEDRATVVRDSLAAADESYALLDDGLRRLGG